LAALALGLAGGCGQRHYEAALPTTLEDVQALIDSEVLEPTEKRAALTALGIDPVIVNGLLKDERLANQFGGDLASAVDKVAADRLTELTPDEVQYYGDATAVTTFSDDQAQAIVDLFIENDLNSLADVADFLDDPTTVLPDEVDETDLRGVFVETSLDEVRDKLP